LVQVIVDASLLVVRLVLIWWMYLLALLLVMALEAASDGIRRYQNLKDND